MTIIHCEFCGKECKGERGLRTHLGWRHADEFTPLGPYDLPWHLITEVDRGFDGMCWVANRGTRIAKDYLRKIVGVTDEKPYIMHLCEIHGEKNKCVNPAHLKAGTPAENALHVFELLRTAGRTHHWVGARHTDEAKAKMSVASRATESRRAATRIVNLLAMTEDEMEQRAAGYKHERDAEGLRTRWLAAHTQEVAA